MTFSSTDSDHLFRLTRAVERMAAADERRNELLEADAAERRASWAEWRAPARLLDPLEDVQRALSADPWRDLPEHQP